MAPLITKTKMLLMSLLSWLAAILGAMWAMFWLFVFIFVQFQPAYEELGLEASGTVVHTQLYRFPLPVQRLKLLHEEISWIEYGESREEKGRMFFLRGDGSVLFRLGLRIRRADVYNVARKLDRQVEFSERIE